MDLILLDKNLVKIKPIDDYESFDSVVGLDSYSDNDFVLKVPYKKELFEKGQFIAYGTSEFGGRIASREIDTERGEVTYKGYSLRGFWQRNHKDVADKTISGTVADHISAFVGWQTGSNLNEKTDIINNAGTSRKSLTYEGATSLLHCIDRADKNFNATLNVSIINSRLKLLVNPKKTHFFDSSQAHVVVEENWSAPTEVYAVNNNTKMGVSAYLQADGTAGNTPYYVGIDTIEEVIRVEAETEEELYASAAEELLKKQQFLASEINVDISQAEVGDMVVASIAEIGLKVEKQIVEKRLKIKKNGSQEITYSLEG